MAVSKTAQAEIPASSLHLQAGALWTLRRNGRLIECTLHLDNSGRVEAQIRRDGELCAVTRCDGLAGALAHGNQLRSDLMATGGWQVCPTAR